MQQPPCPELAIMDGKVCGDLESRRLGSCKARNKGASLRSRYRSATRMIGSHVCQPGSPGGKPRRTFA